MLEWGKLSGHNLASVGTMPEGDFTACDQKEIHKKVSYFD